MRLLPLLAVLLAACALCAPAARASSKEEGEARLARLLTLSADRPLLAVNGHDFDLLVGSPYRPYRLLVWVTSNSGSCAMCSEMRPELALLAATYQAARYTTSNG